MNPPPDFAQSLKGKERIGWDNCRALLRAGRKICALSAECPDVAAALEESVLSEAALRTVRAELEALCNARGDSLDRQKVAAALQESGRPKQIFLIFDILTFCRN